MTVVPDRAIASELRLRLLTLENEMKRIFGTCRFWLFGAVAAGAVLFGSGAMAQSRSFAEVDRNRDGVLSYEELLSGLGRPTADSLWTRGGGRPLSANDIRRLQRDDDDDGNRRPGDGRDDDDDNDDDDDDRRTGGRDDDDDDRRTGGDDDDD